jgi:hypothetical protein
MMQQQINLYEKALHAESTAFAAAPLVGGLALVTAGLLLISLFAWWRVDSLGRNLQAVRTQLARQGALVRQGDGFASAAGGTAAFAARLRTMAAELERRQQALGYLRSGAAGTAGGFSARLEALARERLDGLWLRAVLLTGNSDRFVLSGRAVRAELVPMYLARLQHEPALAGTALQILTISGPKPGSAGAPAGPPGAGGPVSFTVSSGRDPGHGAAGARDAAGANFAAVQR